MTQQKQIKLRKVIVYTLILLIIFTMVPSRVKANPQEDRLHIGAGYEYVDYDSLNYCDTGLTDIFEGPRRATSNIQDFINEYGKNAFDIGKANGIPYIAIIAQAGIESGWGKSTLTTEANNFFGIKAGENWTGPVWVGGTSEQRPDGSIYRISAKFRKYSSPEAGFQGYADFINNNSRYKDALNYPTDPVRYIEELKKAGYATDNAYVQKNVTVQNTVRKYIDEHPELNLQKQEDVVPDKSNAVPQIVPTNNDCTPAPNALSSDIGKRVVQIARQELEKNPIGYDSNVLKYTSGETGAWCAWFVSWIYKESGNPFTGGARGGWSYSQVSVMQAYFQSKHTYIEAGSGLPQPGDIVFFGNHVNIVSEVKGNQMRTIGGNEGGGTGRVKESGWVSTAKNSAPVNGGLEGFGRLNASSEY
ncbi:MAG: glucosaminidase domain-containing protein [Patescibacteria group bacterium]|jgi:hypothetical protein|nr:glucosaminidase domain-containing protein [Patescibacteria group bacterium]